MQEAEPIYYIYIYRKGLGRGNHLHGPLVSQSRAACSVCWAASLILSMRCWTRSPHFSLPFLQFLAALKTVSDAAAMSATASETSLEQDTWSCAFDDATRHSLVNCVFIFLVLVISSCHPPNKRVFFGTFLGTAPRKSKEQAHFFSSFVALIFYLR